MPTAAHTNEKAWYTELRSTEVLLVQDLLEVEFFFFKVKIGCMAFFTRSSIQHEVAPILLCSFYTFSSYPEVLFKKIKQKSRWLEKLFPDDHKEQKRDERMNPQFKQEGRGSPDSCMPGGSLIPSQR